MGLKNIILEKVLVTSWLDFLVQEHLVLLTLVCYFISSPDILFYVVNVFGIIVDLEAILRYLRSIFHSLVTHILHAI